MIAKNSLSVIENGVEKKYDQYVIFSVDEDFITGEAKFKDIDNLLNYLKDRIYKSITTGHEIRINSTNYGTEGFYNKTKTDDPGTSTTTII